MPFELNEELLAEAAALGEKIKGNAGKKPKKHTEKPVYNTEQKAEIIEEFCSTITTIGLLNKNSKNLAPQDVFIELKGNKLVLNKEKFDAIDYDPFRQGEGTDIKRKFMNMLTENGVELVDNKKGGYEINLSKVKDAGVKKLELINAAARNYIYEYTDSGNNYKLEHGAKLFLEETIKRMENVQFIINSLPSKKLLELVVNDNTEICIPTKFIGKDKDAAEQAIDNHFDSHTFGLNYLNLTQDGKYAVVNMDRVFGNDEYAMDLAEGFEELKAEKENKKEPENKKGLAENQPHNKPKPRGR